jgi:hypothetical protein
MAWWLNRTGQPEGPYEEAQIVHMIQSGQLRAGNVCPQGSQAWTPLQAHPGFGAALRAAAGPVASGAPAQRKGKGMRVALIVGGVVVLLGALGLGGLYLSQRGSDEEEYKDGIDKKEAEKRVKAFEKSYAVMKKIDPASAPAIETDGFTVKGARPSFPEPSPSDRTDSVTVHPEDLKDDSGYAGDAVRYRVKGLDHLSRCLLGVATFKKEKKKKRHHKELMQGCTDLKFLFVLRIREVQPAKVTGVSEEGNKRTHHFEKGKVSGDVIGFELASGKPIGGFRFVAESSEIPENQWNSPDKVLDDDLRASLLKTLQEASDKTPSPP